ncbi:MAG: DUF6266 family protein [Bacteroidota bacterium]
MARIKNGILGGFSGKVGTVVGYTLHGKEHMRSLPERTKPLTKNEKKNTSAFGLVQWTLTPLLELLKVSFKNYGSLRGGSKGALSWNRMNAMMEIEGKEVIDPEKFKMSGGDLGGAMDPEYVLESPGIVRFHWDKEVNLPGEKNLDQVLLLAIDFNTRESNYKCAGAFRSMGEETLKLPSKKPGMQWHLYIGFVSADRSIQSDSQYLGKLST